MKDIYELSDGKVAVDEATVFSQFRTLFDLRRRTVVEVGGCLSAERVSEAGVSAWWSIDPRNSPTQTEGVVCAIRGLASSIPLPDKSVDYVFSCNAFQHILDLSESLAEISRVLRPGGYLYANFGPIWSGPDGSHIEALIVGEQRYDFWTHSLLPAWSHLIFDEHELMTLLATAHPQELACAVSHYVFHTSWINRFTLSDYMQALRQSPMEVVFIGGNRAIDYEYCPPAISHPLMERLQPDRLKMEVKKRFQVDELGMRIRDLELILRNH